MEIVSLGNDFYSKMNLKTKTLSIFIVLGNASGSYSNFPLDLEGILNILYEFKMFVFSYKKRLLMIFAVKNKKKLKISF